jgi:6-pyruvoyltetrahydropterin/6-carboxytetrahydropterin synthase
MKKELEVAQEFMFSSAHRLPRYDGPCEDVHGHNYQLTVTVRGAADDYSGMVIDFREIERVVKEKVLSQLDHRNLNDFFENPTCEFLVVWIWDKLKEDLPGLCRVTVHEQPGSSVSYTG